MSTIKPPMANSTLAMDILKGWPLPLSFLPLFTSLHLPKRCPRHSLSVCVDSVGEGTVNLDTEYPKCEFQRSMVPISDSDEPLFGELIFEADTAGAHLLAQCSRMEANQVDSVLVKTRTVLINRDFALLLLFLNKDGSRERLLLFVTIRQNVRADLGVEPTSHQHAQIEVGHQEQHTQNKMGRQEHKRSTVDVDGRPLQIRFMKGNPSMMPFLDFYSKFGDCIETIVIEEDDPPRTGTIVLQTPV